MNAVPRLCLLATLLPMSTVDAANRDPATELDRHCAEIRLGLATFAGEPFRYGRYAGHAGRDNVPMLDALLCRRRQPGAGGGRHAHLVTSDLGLDSRRIEAGVGVQGRYRLGLDLQRQPGIATEGQFLFVNPGSSDLRLPAYWQSGATSAAMPGLTAALKPVALGVDRRRHLFGLRLHIDERWQVDTRYREHRRNGLRGFAGLIGNSGGNPRVALLPEPVDQRTREVDVGLRYAGPRVQARFWLLLSRFDNGHDGLTWDNPYSAISGWHPSAGHPDGRGQAGLMPDNRFSQIGLSLAHALTAHTRGNFDVAVGRMRQDQTFLPYTINPVLADSVHTPLPRNSLDGRVDTRLLHLRLQGRPDRHWHWQLSYRYDERDNRSPRDGYLGIGGDSQLQDPDPGSGRLRYNLPVGHRQQRLSAEAGWRSGRGVDTRFGFERREIDRTWSARASSDETRVHGLLRARIGGSLSAGVRMAHSDRGGGTYLGSRPFLDSHSPAHAASVPGQFENLPGLRQYHLADRRRRHATVFVHLDHDPWHLGLSHGWLSDDYRRSEFGLQAARIRDSMLDLGYAPGGPWSATAFVARERLHFDQAGRAFNGGAVRLEHAADPNRNWFALHRDRVDSAGFGLRREFADGRWRIGIDAAQSLARSAVAVRTGPALSSAPLPDSSARLRTFDVDFEWRFDARSSLLLRWRIEQARSRDFASDGIGPTQLANVILLGDSGPDYRSQAILLGWRRSW